MMKLTKEVNVFDPFVFTERRLYFMQFANDNKEVGFEGVYLCKTVEETKATFITIAQSQGISPKEFYIDNSNYQRFMEIKPMNVMTGFDAETGNYILKAIIDCGMDVESKGDDVDA